MVSKTFSTYVQSSGGTLQLDSFTWSNFHGHALIGIANENADLLSCLFGPLILFDLLFHLLTELFSLRL